MKLLNILYLSYNLIVIYLILPSSSAQWAVFRFSSSIHAEKKITVLHICRGKKILHSENFVTLKSPILSTLNLRSTILWFFVVSHYLVIWNVCVKDKQVDAMKKENWYGQLFIVHLSHHWKPFKASFIAIHLSLC